MLGAPGAHLTRGIGEHLGRLEDNESAIIRALEKEQQALNSLNKFKQMAAPADAPAPGAPAGHAEAPSPSATDGGDSLLDVFGFQVSG